MKRQGIPLDQQSPIEVWWPHLDREHVTACLESGPFPRAVATEYQGRLIAVWIRPDGQPWRPAA